MTEATGESFPVEMLEKSKHQSRYFTEQGAYDNDGTSGNELSRS
jgi:hypothetical protein